MTKSTVPLVRGVFFNPLMAILCLMCMHSYMNNICSMYYTSNNNMLQLCVVAMKSKSVRVVVVVIIPLIHTTPTVSIVQNAILCLVISLLF